MKRSILIVLFTISAIAALNIGMLTTIAYAQDINISYAQVPNQQSSYFSLLNDIINYKAPWLVIAKDKAADQSLGYDLDGNGIFCTQFVYDCLEESGIDFSDAEGKPRSNLSDQENALIERGFVKRKIKNFNTIPAGSVIYAYTKGGSPKHVEFYLGTYDINNLDVDGNPVWSQQGTPLTIGARITDRDPAAGDQLQTLPTAWYGGEVGAFDRFSRGKHYWTYAYIPSWLA